MNTNETPEMASYRRQHARLTADIKEAEERKAWDEVAQLRRRRGGIEYFLGFDGPVDSLCRGGHAMG